MVIQTLRLHRAVVLILLVSLLISCGREDTVAPDRAGPSTPSTRPATDSLDTTTAKSRKPRRSNIHYDIAISLDQTGDQFSGEVGIQFELAQTDTGSDLTLVFGGGSISGSDLNGDTEALPFSGI